MDITLVNNADNLDFGLVGCRRSVPHLQRLLGHLEDALKDWNALSAFRSIGSEIWNTGNCRFGNRCNNGTQAP